MSAMGSKAEKLKASKCLLLVPQQRTFIKAIVTSASAADVAADTLGIDATRTSLGTIN